MYKKIIEIELLHSTYWDIYMEEVPENCWHFGLMGKVTKEWDYERTENKEIKEQEQHKQKRIEKREINQQFETSKRRKMDE